MANPIKRKQVEDGGYISLFVSRDGNNQPDQALRREDGSPTNQLPFDIPFDCEIYALTCGDRDQDEAIATWDLEVEVNQIVVTSLNKPPGQSSRVLELVTPISVAGGSFISIWMRNQNQTIRDPRGSVHLRKRRQG